MEVLCYSGFYKSSIKVCMKNGFGVVGGYYDILTIKSTYLNALLSCPLLSRFSGRSASEAFRRTKTVMFFRIFFSY